MRLAEPVDVADPWGRADYVNRNIRIWWWVSNQLIWYHYRVEERWNVIEKKFLSFLKNSFQIENLENWKIPDNQKKKFKSSKTCYFAHFSGAWDLSQLRTHRCIYVSWRAKGKGWWGSALYRNQKNVSACQKLLLSTRLMLRCISYKIITSTSQKATASTSSERFLIESGFLTIPRHQNPDWWRRDTNYLWKDRCGVSGETHSIVVANSRMSVKRIRMSGAGGGKGALNRRGNEGVWR